MPSWQTGWRASLGFSESPYSVRRFREGWGKHWGQLPHVCPKERTESATAFPVVISHHISSPHLGPRLSQLPRNVCHFLASLLGSLSLCSCVSNKELLIATVLYRHRCSRVPSASSALVKWRWVKEGRGTEAGQPGQGSARGGGEGPLHLGSNSTNSIFAPHPQAPPPSHMHHALTALKNGMLKALPRKPKTTGKKPLGTEGWRKGSVMIWKGWTEGSKAEVPRKAPAFTPKREAPRHRARLGSVPLVL